MYQPSQPIALKYPLWLRLMVAALIVAPLGAAWLVWGQAKPQPEDSINNLLPWLVLGLWLFATYQVFLVELYYDERGVTCISPVAGEVRVNWNEITALFYVKSLDGYVLEADDGRRIWFNDWRSGITDFAEAIQQRLPRQTQGGR